MVANIIKRRINMQKKLCIGLILIMSFILLCGCTDEVEKKGDFYTLQEAYDQGLLTKDALESIAYYQNGGSDDENFVPIPKNPEELSEETENAIKETRVYDIRNDSQEPIKKAKTDDVSITQYYGTYNTCVAVMLDEAYYAYDAALWDVTIGGIPFHYKDGNRIIIWKQN
jgi:hypothetical protein